MDALKKRREEREREVAQAKKKLESFLLIGYGFEANSYLPTLEEVVQKIPDAHLMTALKKAATLVGKTQDDNNYALAMVLSVCMQSDHINIRTVAFKFFSQFCLSESFLFFCIHTSKQIAKKKTALNSKPCGVWGGGFRKALYTYYKNKSVKELTTLLISNQKHFKWTHKDVFKLAHIPHMSMDKKNVVGYFAMKAKEQRKDLSKECEAIACLQDELKTSEDPARIAYLLNEFNKKLTPADARFNTPPVWAEYVEYMTTAEILKYLEYFSKKSLRSVVLPRAKLALEKDDGTGVDPASAYIHFYRYNTCSYRSRRTRAIKMDLEKQMKALEIDPAKESEASGVRKPKKLKTSDKNDAGDGAVDPKKPWEVEPDSAVAEALGRLVARSVDALEKTDEDWLMVVSMASGMRRIVHGHHVPYSVLATGLALHLSGAARSLTVTSPSGQIEIDPLQPEITQAYFDNLAKQKCPDGVVDWTLACAKNTTTRILILTDESSIADDEIMKSMTAFKEARAAESLPPASLLIFGATLAESAIVGEDVWKFKGFHHTVLPLFCRYMKGDLRLFEITSPSGT